MKLVLSQENAILRIPSSSSLSFSKTSSIVSHQPQNWPSPLVGKLARTQQFSRTRGLHAKFGPLE